MRWHNAVSAVALPFSTHKFETWTISGSINWPCTNRTRLRYRAQQFASQWPHSRRGEVHLEHVFHSSWFLPTVIHITPWRRGNAILYAEVGGKDPQKQELKPPTRSSPSKTKASGSFAEDAKHDTVRGAFHVDAADRFGFMRGRSFIPFPSFVTSSWPFIEHPLIHSGQKNRERKRMREAEIMHLSIAAPQRILISGPQCDHSVKTSLLTSCCRATKIHPTRTAWWARGNDDRKSYWHWFRVSESKPLWHRWHVGFTS